MTKAVVFLAVALAAASLGVVGQDSSQSTPSQNNNSSAQASSAQNAQSSTANNASTSAQDATNAQDRTSGPTTGDRPKDIQDPGSASGQPVPGGDRAGKLPQTSTILPLLGLIGLGSLVAGLFARR
jgi:hypothetical protein